MLPSIAASYLQLILRDGQPAREQPATCSSRAFGTRASAPVRTKRLIPKVVQHNIAAMSRPIVTMLTDFGTADYYVSAMKAVLLRHCDNIAVIDITHQVPPHDIVASSFLLERAVASFPPETTHLAIIDP